MNTRAFTLIEVMIVTILVGILSVGLSLSFGGIRESTAFGQHQTRVVEIIQKARGLSLSNRLLNDQPIDSYFLYITNEGIALHVTGPGGVEEVDRFDFDRSNWDFQIDTVFDVYYFPPYGDICFTESCNSGLTSRSFHLYSPSNPELDTQITIDIYGGFPEIDETP